MNDKKAEVKALKIVYPNLEEMPEDIYSNNVRVTHSEDDFVLYFGKVDVPPILPTEKFEKDEIKAEVVARIRLTPSVAEGLLKALDINIKSFKSKKK